MERKKKLLKALTLLLMTLCVAGASAKPKLTLKTVQVPVSSTGPTDEKTRCDRPSYNTFGIIDCEGHDVLIEEKDGLTLFYIDFNDNHAFEEEDEMIEEILFTDEENHTRAVQLSEVPIYLSGGKNGRSTRLTMTGGTVGTIYAGSPIYLKNGAPLSFQAGTTDAQRYNAYVPYFSETVPTGDVSIVITGGTFSARGKLSLSGGLGAYVPATSGKVSLYMSGATYNPRFLEYYKNPLLRTPIEHLVLINNTFTVTSGQDGYPLESELNAMAQCLVQSKDKTSSTVKGGSSYFSPFVLDAYSDIMLGNLTLNSQFVTINLNGHELMGSNPGANTYGTITANSSFLTIKDGTVAKYNISSSDDSSLLTLNSVRFSTTYSPQLRWKNSVSLVPKPGEGSSVMVSKYNDNMWNDDGLTGEATYTLVDAVDQTIPIRFLVSGCLTYSRKIKGGRVATFCLPFAVPLDKINGTVYKFDRFEDNAFKFLEVEDETLDTNTPYLVVADGEADEEIELLKDGKLEQSVVVDLGGRMKDVNCASTNSIRQESTSWAKQIASSDSNGYYFGYSATSGSFVKAKTGSLLPYRTFFWGPSYLFATAPSQIRLRLGDIDPSAIFEVEAEALSGEGSLVYDLQGRRVTSLEKGKIYINNGKKIVK